MKSARDEIGTLAHAERPALSGNADLLESFNVLTP